MKPIGRKVGAVGGKGVINGSSGGTQGREVGETELISVVESSPGTLYLHRPLQKPQRQHFLSDDKMKCQWFCKDTEHQKQRKYTNPLIGQVLTGLFHAILAMHPG